MFTLRLARNFSSKAAKVQVAQGIVVGERRSLPNGQPFQCFQGIPYAQPPVGKLRFRSPLPLQSFNVSELDCSKVGNMCYQRDNMTGKEAGSENCLFLNVYTPHNGNMSQKLPVMVYLHGGRFWFGNGNSDFFYPLELMQQNVIVVTLNYRLGALGFLCLPEAGIYGNAALKDQRLALQWVQQNISQFGGDEQNVTLFGESAGGVCVHLHAYANYANKLFHKIIMQSGTANMSYVFQRNSELTSRHFCHLLGHPNAFTSSSKQLLEFLQSDKVTPSSMLKQTVATMNEDEKRKGLSLVFKPVVESACSPDSIIQNNIKSTLRTPNSLHMPTIMGQNNAEGMPMLGETLKKLKQYDQDLARFIPRNVTVNFNNQQAIEAIAKQMREHYFQGKPLDTSIACQQSLIDLLADYNFGIEYYYAVEWHARFQQQAPLYCYSFNYEGQHNWYKNLFKLQMLKGASHADELGYLFQMEDDKSAWSPQDTAVAKQMAWLWANFAKHGQPTPSEQNEFNIQWNPVKVPATANDKFTLDYLAIDSKCEMLQNPDHERVQFWKRIYSQYGNEGNIASV